MHVLCLTGAFASTGAWCPVCKEYRKINLRSVDLVLVDAMCERDVVASVERSSENEQR